ncbi:restriction endonuclease subunit S [Vibrio cholerae]
MRTVKLSRCCKFFSGGTPTKSNTDYWNGEIPWFSPKDIKAFELVSSQDQISEVAVQQSATRLVAPGTILVVGRSGVLAHTLPVGIVKQPSTFNQDIKAIIPNDGYDPEYIALFLSAHQSLVLKEGVKRGPTVHSLIAGFIEELEIPDIELNKQRQIATRLRAQLAVVETARQAAQEQLSDARLLKNKMLQQAFNALGEIAVRPLGDWVISYRNGFGRRPGNDETGPIVLRIADVSSGEIDLTNPRRGHVSNKEAETYQLNANDLLFIRVNGARHIVGRCCVVNNSVPSDTIFNDHLIRVCLSPDLNPEFARFCAHAPSARGRIEEAASTSAGQLTINQQVISSISVPDLPLEAQKSFVTRIKMQFEEIDALEQSSKEALADIEKLPARILAQAFEN